LAAPSWVTIIVVVPLGPGWSWRSPAVGERLFCVYEIYYVPISSRSQSSVACAGVAEFATTQVLETIKKMKDLTGALAAPGSGAGTLREAGPQRWTIHRV
jgi:hypothetical protein